MSILGVTYTDYDPNTTYPVESGMKAEQDNLMKGFNATLLTSTRAEFLRGSDEKLPSLVFSGASSDRDLTGVIVDVRRVYVVASIVPKTKEGSAASAKFFGSFELTLKN